jgi:Leucine-rich repeat (LRR) protein
LNLESTRVTDASLAHLAKLPNLQVLVLAQTSITDAGMVHLAQLTNLEELHLAGTKVTDAGLNRLRSLKKLRTLDKGPTTAARLEEFRRAMPQCEIKPDDWRPQEK